MKMKYVKPELKKVRLVPTEAVLSSCKTRGILGPQGNLSCLLDASVPCSVIGS